MGQLHKRFTNEQVKLLLDGYVQGRISRSEVEGILEINKTRFFALVKDYRRSPATFSMEYQRETPARLSGETEEAIARELLREKALVDNPKLPIGSYNYSAIRDRLQKRGVCVSVNTIIQRAKQLDCYLPHPRKKVHDREVVTVAVGALVQHDASTHQWSPFASEKWTLITSLDDYSRMLVYAEFVESETSWAHIQAAQAVMKAYGVPLGYYVDNLRVFRFVQDRDSYWRKHVLVTDDVDPQWRQMMRLMGVNVTYALSPQAKGKIERPYRWLQDRIVRTCALENLTTLDEARGVLRSEVDRYNNHQVHSTTGEIPSLRFEKAQNSGSSLFRPFSLPKPFNSPKDVFCLHETRTINGYGYITFFNQKIDVPPDVPDHQDVDLHLIPDLARNNIEVRIWYESKMVRSLTLPLDNIRVHF
ncbi:MAG: integrase catalytic region [Chloroflexi bacterium]|nr:MAG: integrase catalytic region [Chloroflexota bacterium]